jgi:hypothetical protein
LRHAAFALGWCGCFDASLLAQLASPAMAINRDNRKTIV